MSNIKERLIERGIITMVTCDCEQCRSWNAKGYWQTTFGREEFVDQDESFIVKKFIRHLRWRATKTG